MDSMNFYSKYQPRKRKSQLLVNNNRYKHSYS